MPVNASYQRKYYSVKYDDLDTIPKKEGNVIVTYDTDCMYYDVGDPAGSGQNVVRRKTNGFEFVGNVLPSDRHEPTTIFIVDNGNVPDGSGGSFRSYSGYIWNTDADAFYEVFNNLRDFNVKSVGNNSTVGYIVGSPSSGDSTGTLIKNPNIYINAVGDKIHANIEGNADTATSASSATLAQRAVNDNASTPKPITGYLNSVSSDATTNLGTTITFTKGDGTAVPIRVSDTKYNVYTASAAGLVNGTNTTVNSDTSGKILSGDGWISINNFNIPLAEKATKDASGQTITSTYVKSAAYDTSTHNLTLTYGDDTSSSPISIPDTTYSVFSTSANGLVPKANGTGDTAKFLRGDHTWQSINQSNYAGASSGAAGTAGFVPPAAAGQQEYYLKGNGNWGTIFSAGQVGLVPAPASASPDLALKADGTWGACSDTVNTTGAINDTTNLLYLVGAAAQNTSTVTNTNQNVYINNNKLHSNGTEVVNLSDSQALTNKTYEGYSLGDACEATISTSLDSTSPNGNLPNNNAVRSYVSGEVGYLQTMIDTMVGTLLAPAFDATATYAVKDFCTYDDGNGTLLYRCHTAVTTAGDWTGNTNWIATTVIEAIKYLIQNP